MRKSAMEHIEDLNRLDMRGLMIRAEAAEVAGGVTGYVDRWVQNPASDPDVGELVDMLETVMRSFEDRPAAQLTDWLYEALDTNDDPVQIEQMGAEPGPDEPRFPTGLPALDALCSGGYGMTVVSGAPKVGKSLIAMSASIEAAAAGWFVVYLNAELNRGQMQHRAKRYEPTPCKAAVDNLWFFNVSPGISPRLLTDRIAERVDVLHDRILIVQDSINRLAKMGSSGDDRPDSYWAAIDKWGNWARMAAKLSGGFVASLCVSELNANDRVKGLQLEYDASLVVRVKATDSYDTVDIDVPFARSSAGGELGHHIRHWETGRFETKQGRWG